MNITNYMLSVIKTRMYMYFFSIKERQYVLHINVMQKSRMGPRVQKIFRVSVQEDLSTRIRGMPSLDKDETIDLDILHFGANVVKFE